MAQRYTICVNLPRYLPEMEPYEVEDLDAAREAAKAEISECFDLGAEVTSEEYALLDQVDDLGAQGGVISGLPNGYVLDVRPVGVRRDFDANDASAASNQ